MQPKLEIITRKPDVETGKAPLLFVHGMWHGAWCWAERFLPYFARKGHTAWALSLRGHGESEGRERLRWTSLAEYVVDLEAVVEQIGAPAVLIGHSMGGMVVQKYLEEHTAPGAVLLASVPPAGLLAATLRVARQQPLTFLKVNLTLSLYPVIGTPEKCRRFLFSENLDRALAEEYFARMQDESYRAYMDMVLLNLPRPTKGKTPMLVLGAEADEAITVDEVYATARAYGVEAEIFPAMAHDMMLEPGWEAVAERILAWLEAEGL